MNFKINRFDIDSPIVSTVVLNWNRKHLLEKTIYSYLSTISVPFELTIIDNASKDGSREWLKSSLRNDPRIRMIFLDKNYGGDAINKALVTPKGRIIHISENDIEYKKGWDRAIINKFSAFPDLGQLSPFSPFPEEGEVWVTKQASKNRRGNETIYLTDSNIGTTCFYRKEIYDYGVRWETLPGEFFLFPNDEAFSFRVRECGYKVAWSDAYLVKNWGHHIHEMKNNLGYYIQNYRAKPYVGINGLKTRLNDKGFDLVCSDNKWHIEKRSP